MSLFSFRIPDSGSIVHQTNRDTLRDVVISPIIFQRHNNYCRANGLGS